ncbi:ClpXP protease specificity-enhancing factor [Lysobacter korlensis]|uniref:ClpXP protease specificity-enhancing factor n=1 Tax=Lysobacter korlensis TaxID=553636 RepID=A0ABV6RPI6_9GAMM
MRDPMSMTSHRPYLLRALYEWIADNGMTPHLLVDATRPGVQVPSQSVNDGKVVLNVAERAVSQLQMSNDAISFSARFGGVSFPVSVPVSAVLAIYARETGQGMALPDDGMLGSEPEDETEGEEEAGVLLSAVPSSPDDTSDDDDDGGPSRPSPRRSGHLRVVK